MGATATGHDMFMYHHACVEVQNTFKVSQGDHIMQTFSLCNQIGDTHGCYSPSDDNLKTGHAKVID